MRHSVDLLNCTRWPDSSLSDLSTWPPLSKDQYRFRRGKQQAFGIFEGRGVPDGIVVLQVLTQRQHQHDRLEFGQDLWLGRQCNALDQVAGMREASMRSRSSANSRRTGSDAGRTLV